MATFYFATSGHGWHVSTNWLSALDVRDWHGISCVGGGQSESATDEDNVEKYTYNYIAGITLELNHLVGTMPMELTGICRIILCAATTTTFWNHSWPSPNSPSFSGTLPEDQVSIDNHHDLGTTKEETFVGHALDWWPNKRTGNNIVPVVTTVNVNVDDSVAIAIVLTRRRIPVQIGIVQSSP
jgi:hypothetical protein